MAFTLLKPRSGIQNIRIQILPYAINFYISKDILEKIGIGIGTNIDVFYDDKIKGKFLIKKTSSKGRKLRMVSNKYVFTIRNIDNYKKGSIQATYEIESDGVIIQIPTEEGHN